jgi:hypothetical protein
MEPWVANQSGAGFYAGGDAAQPQPAQETAQPPSSVAWDASEYIHHEKGASWMFALIGVGLVMVAAAIWLAQWTLMVVLIVMLVTFGYYAFRKPKTVHYTLDHTALTIAGKMYPLDSFRSFGVVEEGAFFSIRLIPVKRFGLLQVAYVSDQEGEAVVDILGSHLPMEEMHSDPIEKLMSKLRF